MITVHKRARDYSRRHPHALVEESPPNPIAGGGTRSRKTMRLHIAIFDDAELFQNCRKTRKNKGGQNRIFANGTQKQWPRREEGRLVAPRPLRLRNCREAFSEFEEAGFRRPNSHRVVFLQTTVRREKHGNYGMQKIRMLPTWLLRSHHQGFSSARDCRRSV